MSHSRPCLLLAGGVPRPGEPLWEETRGAPKALLDVAGRPMLQWVLDALAGAESIGRVVVVGVDPPAGVDHPGPIEWVPRAGSLVENLYAGIEALLAADASLGQAAFCWSDIPLARGSMLDRFAAEALHRECDVAAGLVRRADLEGRFPEVREGWLRLDGGEYVAADFGFFRPAKAAALRRDLEALADRRKSALRQAWRVGFGLLWRYLLGVLSIADLEGRLERRFDVRPRILTVADPELGLDVDGPGNLEICRRELGRRPSP